jgi:hypothetical protein
MAMPTAMRKFTPNQTEISRTGKANELFSQRRISRQLSQKMAGIFNSAWSDSGIDTARPGRAITAQLKFIRLFCEFASSSYSPSENTFHDRVTSRERVIGLTAIKRYLPADVPLEK